MTRTHRAAGFAFAAAPLVALLAAGCVQTVREAAEEQPVRASVKATAARGGIVQDAPQQSSAPTIADVADVSTTRRVVALTFDDGPDPRFTPAVLRILRKEDARATFFVLGPSVLRHPDLVRAERDQGSEIGCHGWAHVVLMQRSTQDLLRDYSRCADAVQSVVGFRPRIVRPPYGLLMPAQFRVLRDAGYAPIVWDISAAPLDHPAKRVAALLKAVHPGAVMLLHDGRKKHRHDLQALPSLIRGLRARGYSFVTVSQLLADGRPLPEPQATLRRRYCYRERLPRNCEMPGVSPLQSGAGHGLDPRRDQRTDPAK